MTAATQSFATHPDAVRAPDSTTVARLKAAARDVEPALLPLVALAGLILIPAAFARDASAGDWGRFVGLLSLGLVAHTLIARADRARAGDAAAVVALAAGALLLPLELLVPLALVLALPRCLLAPRAALAARSLKTVVEVAAATASKAAAAGTLALGSVILGGEGVSAIAGLAACAAFVAVDYVARPIAAAVGRDETRALAPSLTVGTELVLTALGAGLAVAWLTEPWLGLFAVAPLLLVRRWFEIPMLEQQARRDAKTGLYNARYFELAVERELEEAKIAGTPLAVLVADLDLLREINNAHGHLAGDAVLRGIGTILQEHVRSRDVPARFGGEEFAVLLPETSRTEALEIAERLRTAVAEASFSSGTAETGLKATVSIGVASYPDHGSSAVQLIHSADLAVYRAKLQGRNRVLAAKGDSTLDLVVGSSDALRLVPGSRKDDVAHTDATSRQSGSLVSLLMLGNSRLPLASLAGVAALVALALLGITQASYLTAMIAPAIGGAAILMLRREASAQVERDSAALARARAEHLRRGADTLQTLNRSLEHANRLLRERSAAAMETLSAVIDARDAHTAGHSRRVQTLALVLGRELGLSRAELEILGHAARFHDVGKLAVPESILLKSDRLVDLDWLAVRRHPEEGARLIAHLGFLEDTLPAIRHHHERFDGSGYPDGLAGDDIPLGARIIHLADALDAMLMSRPYRPALDPLEALEQIRSGSGVQFCPRCVDALDRVMLAEFAKGADVPRELLVG